MRMLKIVIWLLTTAATGMAQTVTVPPYQPLGPADTYPAMRAAINTNFDAVGKAFSNSAARFTMAATGEVYYADMVSPTNYYVWLSNANYLRYTKGCFTNPAGSSGGGTNVVYGVATNTAYNGAAGNAASNLAYYVAGAVATVRLDFAAGQAGLGASLTSNATSLQSAIAGTGAGATSLFKSAAGLYIAKTGGTYGASFALGQYWLFGSTNFTGDPYTTYLAITI